MKTPSGFTEYRQSIDTLDRAIVGLTTKINATTYELLVLVRQFDERGGWLRHNFANCAEWLAYRCDLSSGAAREKVRVAHALKALPAIAEGFETGALSYSKVRALTRVANESNEAALLEFARTTTVTCVEERCLQLRNVQPGSVDEANRAHGRRSLTMRRNAEAGMLTITVDVPIEDGELIEQALAKAMEKYAPATPEFASESFRAQQADALESIARDCLVENTGGRTSSADAYQVVVHVDQSALTEGKGRSDLPLTCIIHEVGPKTSLELDLSSDFEMDRLAHCRRPGGLSQPCLPVNAPRLPFALTIAMAMVRTPGRRDPSPTVWQHPRSYMNNPG